MQIVCSDTDDVEFKLGKLRRQMYSAGAGRAREEQEFY